MLKVIAVLFFLLIAHDVFAYIDPSHGLPFFSWGAFLFGILLSFLGGILFVFKRFFKSFRRYLWIILILLCVVWFFLGRYIVGVNMEFPKKIVILGMDALDYELIRTFIDEKELPHFKTLKDNGTFSPLKTVMPPESNVVWTSFATGMKPGNHGIFDFIMRDPQNYLPYLSLVNISQKPKVLKIGPFSIPLFEPSLTATRKSAAFWEIASRYNIPNYTYFCPGSFPPDQVYGKLVSGMGVPDIRGTMGTFSFYTTQSLEKDTYTGGLVFPVKKKDGAINSFLYGPRNTAKKPAQDIKIPFTISAAPDSRHIIITIQKERIILQKGEWSDWVSITFRVGMFHNVRGICRFYLKNISPHLELYCSPVNIDPQHPLFPISYPKSFSKKIVERIGLYYTQGMPYDTWALNEGRTTEDIFLEQAHTVLDEREKMLKQELAEFRGGIFFFYFEYPDSIQHMFWRFQSMKGSPYAKVILHCYKKMDTILGWVMDHIDENTTLIVLSDHGFAHFTRSVHLNSWLRDNGFLYLHGNSKQSKEFFANIDWDRTKAYALGLGGIYINQKGRERKGIVLAGTGTEKVKKEIIEKLNAWHDSQIDMAVVKKTYTKEEIFSGTYNQNAPDLFVGFHKGYRASWQTALGAVPAAQIEDNTKAWRGDHIFDSTLVPGVFFINQKVALNRDPDIIDIIPTVFNVLKVNGEDVFDGSPLFD